MPQAHPVPGKTVLTPHAHSDQSSPADDFCIIGLAFVKALGGGTVRVARQGEDVVARQGAGAAEATPPAASPDMQQRSARAVQRA
jgi:hypothetical protein